MNSIYCKLPMLQILCFILSRSATMFTEKTLILWDIDLLNWLVSKPYFFHFCPDMWPLWSQKSSPSCRPCSLVSKIPGLVGLCKLVNHLINMSFNIVWHVLISNELKKDIFQLYVAHWSKILAIWIKLKHFKLSCMNFPRNIPPLVSQITKKSSNSASKKLNQIKKKVHSFTMQQPQRQSDVLLIFFT